MCRCTITSDLNSVLMSPVQLETDIEQKLEEKDQTVARNCIALQEELRFDHVRIYIYPIIFFIGI